VFGLAISAIGIRAGTLCVTPSDRTVALGSQQRWEQMTLRARRGSIYDRDGHRLVSSVDTPNVVVDPAFVDPADLPMLARNVARILDLPYDEVVEKMRRDTRYARLAVRVHPRIAGEVLDLGHKALFVESDQQRYYAESELGSHVLGYVDARGEGKSGVEASMDDWLRGSSVLLQRRRDRRGLDVDRMDEVDRTSSAGMDVHLTLDRQIQRITERALANVELHHAPAATMAAVVDVRTGDLLALANTPTYNPNALPTDPSPMRNRAVLDAIEPGSVFKPFVAAAAIEEGKVRLDTEIDCENGLWRVGRTRIGDDHPHGVITVSEVIKYSSNIGSAKMAFMLGATDYLDYMRAFGFGDRLGLDLPGERSGYLRSASRIKPVELATTSYGQGATSTVLQLAYATATIANGGVRMKPRLVSQVVDEDGVPAMVQEPEEVARVVSEETAAALTAAMITVTEKGGTATRAAVPGYRVAGKTGTAWKVEGGKYTDARIGSFIGFIPADDPVLAVVVVVDDPQKGSRYGGIVAAPAFAEIAGQSLAHLGVAPDPSLLPIPNDTAPTEPDAELAPPVQLAYADEGWVLPDLSGNTLREALVALQGTGLEVRVEGTGRLAAMTPPPGTRLDAGSDVTLHFGAPPRP
jgi:cell division protein FtsI (penicillin-binding protein 3)